MDPPINFPDSELRSASKSGGTLPSVGTPNPREKNHRHSCRKQVGGNTQPEDDEGAPAGLIPDRSRIFSSYGEVV